MATRTQLHERFHEARADLFVRLMKPEPGMTLLDLGGARGDFSERIAKRVPGLQVTVADIHPYYRPDVEARGFRYVQLPESDRLPFGKWAFDIVLSNSVIEHVTGFPKERTTLRSRVPQREWVARARGAQAVFAREVRRVGKAYFVQTPHRSFPVCQHLHVPFSHWLPRTLQCHVARLADLTGYRHSHDTVDWYLLDERRMRDLFGSGFVHVERYTGLPKSLIAYFPTHLAAIRSSAGYVMPSAPSREGSQSPDPVPHPSR